MNGGTSFCISEAAAASYWFFLSFSLQSLSMKALLLTPWWWLTPFLGVGCLGSLMNSFCSFNNFG